MLARPAEQGDRASPRLLADPTTAASRVASHSSGAMRAAARRFLCAFAHKPIDSRPAIAVVNRFSHQCDVRHTEGRGRIRILAALLTEHGCKEMIHKVLAAAAVILAAGLPVQGEGGAKAPVEARLDVERIVRAPDGHESRSSADSAKPGDILEYVVTYRNTTRDPVRDLQATLPIPPATELVAGSARPATARASLDSREFAAMPLKRKVKRDGREVEESVPLHDYRYLRWSIAELRGGESMTFSARVRVLE